MRLASLPEAARQRFTRSGGSIVNPDQADLAFRLIPPEAVDCAPHLPPSRCS